MLIHVRKNELVIVRDQVVKVLEQEEVVNQSKENAEVRLECWWSDPIAGDADD